VFFVGSSFISTFLGSFQPAQRLSLLEFTEVEVGWGDLEEHLGLNDRARADVVARCKNKLVVQYPVWLAIDDCARMDHDDLVILERLVVPIPLQEGHLHEVAGDD